MDFEIRKISIEDELFPESLRKIKRPPKELYYCGQILPKENCLAIVGARTCSKYGTECCLEIGSQIAASNLTIVSGLARGIDSFAHFSAVKNKRRTIAVLGTALDKENFYPKENLKLAEEILKNNGLIISEYAPGSKTGPYAFAERNRLIAGLSLGTLMIEAREKSGSLITAANTLEQGKKLFVVPGNIHSLLSKGGHALIKNGAKLVESGEDILRELKIDYLPNIIKSDKPTLSYGNDEEKILNALSENSLDIETLIKLTGLPANKIMGLLAALEIKNKITNLGDNIFCLNRQ